MAARMNMRRQTIWFFFLVVTGFSLAIELTFELFRQILSRQEVEAEKDKAELALYKARLILISFLIPLIRCMPLCFPDRTKRSQLL